MDLASTSHYYRAGRQRTPMHEHTHPGAVPVRPRWPARRHVRYAPVHEHTRPGAAPAIPC
eukprot:364299-Chlamydomonas_euryale.AAC.8